MSDNEHVIQMNNKKKYLIIALGIIFIIYTGVSFFFLNHFYIGTKINGVDVSLKSIEGARESLLESQGNYFIQIEGRNGLKETITGEKIEFKYETNDKINDIKSKQIPFAWLTGSLNSDDYEAEGMISFNKDKLNDIGNSSVFFDSSNIVEPKNATFEYKDNKYSVVKEDNGCKVNNDLFFAKLYDEVSKGNKSLNLETEMCYEEPKIKADSKEITRVIEELNKYVSSKITYIVHDKTYVVDGDRISNWLSVSDNYAVVLNEEAVNGFMDDVASNYNTIGKIRSFNTSLGTVATVSGGDYGIYIDTSTEVNELIAIIKEGKAQEKEPEFAQAAMANGGNDIGSTYVEINLTTQHMWFYSNGNLITQGDVVTGNVSSNHITPPGVYRLKYKQRNAVLRGPGYESPVSFWMPFNQDIGIHDATWRGSFGGSIYKSNGSHGCVNSPYPVAQAIFDNIQPGTPVVCYY